MAANIELDEFQEAAWRDIKAGHNTLVTGPAGTGKSALIQHVIAKLEGMGKRVLVTALTGQAGELIGGLTLHSAVGYGKVEKVKGFRIAPNRETFLSRLDVFIVDECSMLSAEFLQHFVGAVTHARLAGDWKRLEALRRRREGRALFRPRPRPPCPKPDGRRTCWHCLHAVEAAEEQEERREWEGAFGFGSAGAQRHRQRRRQRQAAAADETGEELAGGSESEGELFEEGGAPAPGPSAGGTGPGPGSSGQRAGRQRRRSVDPSKPLAGLQIIFSGDFLQLPPVTKEGDHDAQKKAAKAALLRKMRDPGNRGALRPGKVHDNAPFLNRGLAFQSKAWQALGVRVHELRRVHRQSDRAFVEILHAIRTGDCKPHHISTLRRMCCRPLPPSPHSILPTELFATNSRVDDTNRHELAQLAGPAERYTAHDYVVAKLYKSDTDPGAALERRRAMLEDMKEQVLGNNTRIPASLELKARAQVMLAANVCMSPYLVNGSRGVVVGFVDARHERRLLERQIEVLECMLTAMQGSDDDFEIRLPERRGKGSGGATCWLANAAQQAPAPPQGRHSQPASPARSAGDAVPASRPSQTPPPPQQQQQPTTPQLQPPPAPTNSVSPGESAWAALEGVRGWPSPGHKRQLDYGAAEQEPQRVQSPGPSPGGSPVGSGTALRRQAQQGQEQPAEGVLSQLSQARPSQPEAPSWLSRQPQGQQAERGPASQPLSMSRQATPPLEDLFGTQPTQPTQPMQQPACCGRAAAWQQLQGEAPGWQDQPYQQQQQQPWQQQQQQQQQQPWQQQQQQQKQQPTGSQDGPWSRQPGPQAQDCSGGCAPPLSQQGGAGAQEGPWGAGSSGAAQFGQCGAQLMPAQNGALPWPLQQPPQQQQQQPWQQQQHPSQQQQQHISFPYSREPVPKQLAMARAELKALVALLRARGEVDTQGHEVGDATLELLRQRRPGLGQARPWGGAAHGGTPQRSQASGGTGAGAGAAGRLVLPLVLFQSCPKLPIVVKPREVRHKVRNVGDIVRIQLPLLLAWAMSIHKSQGASLDRVRVNLASCFADGQVYVALSRARSMEGLEVINLDPARIRCCTQAKIFYQSGGEWQKVWEYPVRGDLFTCFLEAVKAQRPLRLQDLPSYLPGQQLGTPPSSGPGAGLTSASGGGRQQGGTPSSTAGAPCSPAPGAGRPVGLMPTTASAQEKLEDQPN